MNEKMFSNKMKASNAQAEQEKAKLNGEKTEMKWKQLQLEKINQNLRCQLRSSKRKLTKEISHYQEKNKVLETTHSQAQKTIQKHKHTKTKQQLQLEDYKRTLADQAAKMEQQEQTIQQYQQMMDLKDEHSKKQKQKYKDKYYKLKGSYATLKDKSCIRIESLNQELSKKKCEIHRLINEQANHHKRKKGMLSKIFTHEGKSLKQI